MQGMWWLARANQIFDQPLILRNEGFGGLVPGHIERVAQVQVTGRDPGVIIDGSAAPECFSLDGRVLGKLALIMSVQQ